MNCNRSGEHEVNPSSLGSHHCTKPTSTGMIRLLAMGLEDASKKQSQIWSGIEKPNMCLNLIPLTSCLLELGSPPQQRSLLGFEAGKKKQHHMQSLLFSSYQGIKASSTEFDAVKGQHRSLSSHLPTALDFQADALQAALCGTLSAPLFVRYSQEQAVIEPYCSLPGRTAVAYDGLRTSFADPYSVGYPLIPNINTARSNFTQEKQTHLPRLATPPQLVPLSDAAVAKPSLVTQQSMCNNSATATGRDDYKQRAGETAHLGQCIFDSRNQRRIISDEQRVLCTETNSASDPYSVYQHGFSQIKQDQQIEKFSCSFSARSPTQSGEIEAHLFMETAKDRQGSGTHARHKFKEFVKVSQSMFPGTKPTHNECKSKRKQTGCHTSCKAAKLPRASAFNSKRASKTLARQVAVLLSELKRTKQHQSHAFRVKKIIPLHLPSDTHNLSPFQCLVREQISLFVAQKEDVECNAQGRNRPIVMGQVGIVCRHCAEISPKYRSRGAVYFPSRLSGVYQAAQNMVHNHLLDTCLVLPEGTRRLLRELKVDKSSIMGGGKLYWATAASILGVRESESSQILEFERAKDP